MNWYTKISMPVIQDDGKTYLEIGHQGYYGNNTEEQEYIWWIDENEKFNYQPALDKSYGHKDEDIDKYTYLSHGRCSVNKNGNAECSLVVNSSLTISMMRKRQIEKISEEALDEVFNNPSIHMYE